MLTQEMNDVIAVRLDKGEEIVASLRRVCADYGVTCAKIDGLGAVSAATVCLFDTAAKQYHETALSRFLEMTNLCGNVSQQNGEVYLHLHITLADENGRAFGGHLKEAFIGATAELFVTRLSGKIDRVRDEATGLNLFAW
ncbi:MAG: DUF296 domain-containing protein [Clostridia bacterium]|jgi:predicted DNA-binding protein with PD1-like motif|nr:DUF296 domain-containing protein [Clostridia bacterium]